MAVLPRRDWPALLTELEARLARSTASFEARAKEVLAAVHYDLGLLFHHPELDAFDQSLVCSTSVPYVDLAATVYVPISLVLRNPTTNAIAVSLKPASGHFTFAKYDGTSAMPTSYSRFKNRVWFDQLPDLAYPIDLFSYNYPTAPDFTTGKFSDLGRLWDEHLLEAATAKLQGILWRPELAGQHAELLRDFLGRVPQRSLVEMPLPEMPDRGLRGQQIGGPQG